MKNVTIFATWEENVARLNGKNKKTYNSPLWSAVFLVLAWLFLSVTPVQAGTSCFINFTSPFFVPVIAQLTDILIDDQCEYLYGNCQNPGLQPG